MEVYMLINNLSSSRLGSLLQQPEQTGVSPLAKQHNIAKSNQFTTLASSAPATNETSINSKASSRWFNSDRLIAAAESDPSYAKEMAKTYAYVPDKMMLNWADAPSPANKEAFDAWANQSNEFDKVAAPVIAQRIDLYNSLKAQGTADVDVLKAMINFNGSQPPEYQIKTGFWKLNVTA
jgi:hypothetical protein